MSISRSSRSAILQLLTASLLTGFFTFSSCGGEEEVTPGNQAPVLASIETDALAYIENQPATAITSTLTVSDADASDLSSATVQITANYQNGQDVLSFVNESGITGSWNAATGTLTLSGSATPAVYQAAIRKVTYVNTSADPSSLSRTVSFTVNDGTVDSNKLTRTITVSPVFSITSNPAITHQEMIGFGGALTWYCNWMTTSTKKTEIADLLFTDLGIDIIRFKNWYYPDDYPTVKTTDVMNDDYSKIHWDATNELYTLAKARNANVKILLSSWGPPAALKSNNSTRETTGGATNNTLKKSGGLFMYDEFAQYWYDVLDHVPFDPDYISIQNEPTFSNTGWTTCTWSSAEGTLPSYITAFDKVYDKIKDRTFVPKMIGPESQDLFTYSPFVNLLKDKTHCSGFGYHPYNVNSGTSSTDIVSQLTSVGNLSTKPNIMTEFSDNLDWFNTAQFIQNTLLHANSAGYIYWKLVWAKPSSGTDAGMVSLANSGASTYTVTPYYHLIKHFAKHVDAGYHRVDVASTNANLVLTAFSNPAGTKLTVIALNKGAGQIPIDLKATGKTIKAISGNQSKSGSYYQALTTGSVTESIPLPPQSITTFVLDVE